MMSAVTTLESRTALSIGEGARAATSAALLIVARAWDGTVPPLEVVEYARALRRAAMTVEDRAVLGARARGVPWTDIARALGLSEERVRARYEVVYDTWAIAHLDPDPGGARVPGTPSDMYPEATAHALDAWCARQGVTSGYAQLLG